MLQVTSEKSPVIVAEHSTRPSNVTLHLTEPLHNDWGKFWTKVSIHIADRSKGVLSFSPRDMYEPGVLSQAATKHAQIVSLNQI